MQRQLEVAIQAARRGADELMQRRLSRQVSEKSPRDLVTDADLASQTAIRQVLSQAFPSHAFVGEEQGAGEPPAEIRGGQAGAPACWIVDPLDGTVNYVHGLAGFAVSIGLLAAGRLQVGVVYDPVADEMFTATAGGGARLNGTALQSSRCDRLSDALLACSFPPGARRDAPEVRQFAVVLERAQSLRRLGSCALNLCYVAAGRLDGYWATSVKSWDVAAGVLIAREAGATVTAVDGSPLDIWNPRFAAAASEPLRRDLVDVLAEPAAPEIQNPKSE